MSISCFCSCSVSAGEELGTEGPDDFDPAFPGSLPVLVSLIIMVGLLVTKTVLTG